MFSDQAASAALPGLENCRHGQNKLPPFLPATKGKAALGRDRSECGPGFLHRVDAEKSQKPYHG
jgi:hypothetical protein